MVASFEMSFHAVMSSYCIYHSSQFVTARLQKLWRRLGCHLVQFRELVFGFTPLRNTTLVARYRNVKLAGG